MSEAHGKSQPSFHGGGHEEEEEGGAPEWLISFADMDMLLMGFFVILFALNVQPKSGNAGGGGEESEGAAMSARCSISISTASATSSHVLGRRGCVPSPSSGHNWLITAFRMS